MLTPPENGPCLDHQTVPPVDAALVEAARTPELTCGDVVRDRKKLSAHTAISDNNPSKAVE
jgi:hypothetical protein